MAHFEVGHVVEEDDVDVFEGEEAFDLLDGVCFEFDADVGVFGFDLLDGVLEVVVLVFCEEVVVFDHDHVVEAHAVVGAAAAGDGVFFQPAPAWGGFACVEDFGGGIFDEVDVGFCGGGDGAESLEEVEGGAFGGEDAGGAAGDLEDGVAGFEGDVVVFFDEDGEGGVEGLEDGGGDVYACGDAWLFGEDASVAGGVFGHEEFGGEVAGADVFIESGLDEVGDWGG